MTQRLPSNPIDRAAALLTNSLPGTRMSLPGALPADAAELVMEARNHRAQMYASMEDLSDRLRQVAEQMDRTGVVLHLVDEEDESSLVEHMEAAARTLADQNGHGHR